MDFMESPFYSTYYYYYPSLFTIVVRTIFNVFFTGTFYSPELVLPNYYQHFYRIQRGGQRKQRPIPVIIGHRPTRTNQSPHRPQSTLIPVSTQHDRPNEAANILKFLLINTQSAKNKIILLNEFLADNKVDVAFYTESWLSPCGDEATISELTPPGYKSFSIPRITGRGGGIFILYKNFLNTELVCQFTFKTFECCQIKITTKEQSKSFVCIYRPPPSKKNKHTAKEFIDEFSDLLDALTLKGSIPYILGDFNLHFDNHNDGDVKKMKTILSTFGLEQIISSSTHKRNHILDWILTINPATINDIDVSDHCLSDHYPIQFSIKMTKPPLPKITITSRDTKIDHDKFAQDMKTKLLDTTSSVEEYNLVLSELLDQHAPVRTRTVTQKTSAPWMNEDIKEAKSERRRAERQWRSSGLTVHRDIFKSISNTVRSLIKKAKHAFFNNKIYECTTSKALYCVTNSICGKKAECELPKNIAEEDIPDAFGQYFRNKVSDIRHKLDNTPTDPPNFEPFHGDVLCEFSSVTEDEVKKIIQSSPPKSCCLDPIPTPLLLKHIDIIIPVITTIMNASLQSGTVPKSFKHAIVTPILKKANLSPDDLKNFRPVSNLPFLSKILEKIVAAQLKTHLNKYELYETNQSAYRQFHNTETALLKIQNDLLCAADEGNVSVLALLDLSAAFDTIDHSVLVERLSRSFGLSGTVLRWFDSYLIGRTQAVQIKGLQSSSFTLDFGVPQGSVLGPILYTLYTQPLGAVIRHHNVNYHMYADDTQLYSSVKPENVTSLILSMENCIEDVRGWMTANKLKMNDDKTEVLFCNPKNYVTSASENAICINDAKIAFSNKARNLGIVFSNNLSMENHVAHLCKLIYWEIRRIGQLSAFLDEMSLKILISSFVFTRFDYCNSLLANSPDFLLEKLQRLQNQAARLVLRRCRREHVTPMLLRLHWLPIKARVVYKIGVMCYKCMNGSAPPYLSELVQLHTPLRSLRSGERCLMTVPKRGSKRFSDRAFSHFAPSIWNDLPLSLRRLETEAAFKDNLKTLLVRKFLLY